MAKQEYLKSNNFKVTFESPTLSKESLEKLSESIFKLGPDMVAQTMEVMFLVPADQVGVEALTDLIQCHVSTIRIQPKLAKGGLAPFEIIAEKPKCVAAHMAFDYEDRDELILSVLLEFWSMSIAVDRPHVMIVPPEE